jgi:hypothetical protein
MDLQENLLGHVASIGFMVQITESHPVNHLFEIFHEFFESSVPRKGLLDKGKVFTVLKALGGPNDREKGKPTCLNQ